MSAREEGPLRDVLFPFALELSLPPGLATLAMCRAPKGDLRPRRQSGIKLATFWRGGRDGGDRRGGDKRWQDRLLILVACVLRVIFMEQRAVHAMRLAGAFRVMGPP